jgi:hypothetical protein
VVAINLGGRGLTKALNGGQISVGVGINHPIVAPSQAAAT